MKTVLTADGSFAQAYLKEFNDAEIASMRVLGKNTFVDKLRGAKVVIHNAASLDNVSLEYSLERNFDFTRFLVNQLIKVNPGAHLVFLSSMSILDPEDSLLYSDFQQMPPYAYSKYLAETYCLKSDLQHISCVRFSTLFYKDPKKDGLSKLVADAISNGSVTLYNQGTARRNFLPIDIAAGYVNKLGQLKAPPKKTYNFVAPHATSFKEATLLIKKHVPELLIKDRAAPSAAPVLADFDLKDIQAMGVIDFSLEDSIATYVKALQA